MTEARTEGGLIVPKGTEGAVDPDAPKAEHGAIVAELDGKRIQLPLVCTAVIHPSMIYAIAQTVVGLLRASAPETPPTPPETPETPTSPPGQSESPEPSPEQ
jgi:hypothetical protein